ncbi:MAG: hypothetical protein ACOCXB_07440 [Halanaerobium sp.]
MKNKFLLIILIAIFIFTINFPISAENKNEDLYSGNNFRNPFEEYTEPAESEAEDGEGEESEADDDQNQNSDSAALSIEDIKTELPFSLNGIISSNREKVALLNTGDNVEFVRGSYEKEGYRVTSIEKNSIVVEKRGFKLRLKIGGEIDEI